ncbi:MAG: glycosyltransferase [Myxococcales bacterium]|nr:glycosyltransferase [Myxococcales bacterium]
MKKRTRLGIIAILPSYYQDEIWRRLAADDDLDVVVVYLSDVGVREDFDDRTLGGKRHWRERIDLDAYENVFVENYGSQDLPGPLFRINPGLYEVLRREQFDVILLPGHSTVSTLGVALYCIATNTPVIYRGEAIPLPESGGVLPKIRRSVDRTLLRKFDSVLYSCTRNRAFFEMHGVARERLALIP